MKLYKSVQTDRDPLTIEFHGSWSLESDSAIVNEPLKLEHLATFMTIELLIFRMLLSFKTNTLESTYQSRAMYADVSTGLTKMCPSKAGRGSSNQRNNVSLVPKLTF